VKGHFWVTVGTLSTERVKFGPSHWLRPVYRVIGRPWRFPSQLTGGFFDGLTFFFVFSWSRTLPRHHISVSALLRFTLLDLIYSTFPVTTVVLSELFLSTISPNTQHM